MENIRLSALQKYDKMAKFIMNLLHVFSIKKTFQSFYRNDKRKDNLGAD